VLTHSVQISVSRCATLNCPTAIIAPANSTGADSATPAHDVSVENLVCVQVSIRANTSFKAEPVWCGSRQMS
jgi:hypothetical protein